MLSLEETRIVDKFFLFGFFFVCFEGSMKILGIGRNYAQHAKELGNKVVTNPKEMVIFLKPASSLLSVNAGPIVLPKGADVHHEVELGV